jgi:hypothetical protein
MDGVSKTRELAAVAMNIDSTTHDSAQSIYEPTRCIQSKVPPNKRFFRTFWRSAARRILALKSLNQKEIST